MRAVRAGRWTGLAVLVAVAAVTVGCSRGPDATALRTEVQGKLDQRFKPGLFGLDRIPAPGERARCPASESGAKRLAVYFNATLKLNQGYDFGDWEGLSPGDPGARPGSDREGHLRAQDRGEPSGRGDPGLRELHLRMVGDRWQSVEATTAGVAKTAEPGNAAPASRSKQLIDRLAAMVEIPPPGSRRPTRR